MARNVSVGMVVALATAVAQAPVESGRGRALGFVVDANGKRVPGAEVVLLSWPMPPQPHVGQVDRVDTLTDAEGLFRADLLHGRPYSAFALWRDADGQPQRSAVTERVTPGPPRELRAVAAQAVRRVRVTGREVWRARGPLRLRARLHSDNPLVVDLPLDGEGVASLPELPGAPFSLEVRAADGVLLHCEHVDLVKRVEPEATLALGAPRRVLLRVRDDAGKPIVGARVQQANALTIGARLAATYPDLLGQTDAVGQLAIEAPARGPFVGQSSDELIVIVVAPGHARVLGSVGLATEGATSELVLSAASALRGRLVDPDGQPVRDALLTLDAWAQIPTRNGGAGTTPAQLPVDDGGHFHFHGLHPDYEFRLYATFDAARAAALGLQIKPAIPLAPLQWLVVGEPPFAAAHDLGDLRLRDLTVAQIEVRRNDAEPVPGAQLQVTTMRRNLAPLVYTTDRHGRLQLPLPVSELRIGAFESGGGVAAVTVRVPAGPDDPSLHPLMLTLTRPVPVSGVVVDADGKPVAGAIVRPWNRPEGCDPALAELAYRSHTASPPTGADGRFTLLLPVPDVKARIKAYRPGEPNVLSDEIVLEVGTAPIRDLRVALRR